MDWERVESVRWWGRSLLVIAAILIVTPVFLSVSAPAFPYDATEPTLAGILIAVIEYAGMLFGLAWMWRIHRAPMKHDDRALWRYRDR